MGCAGVTTLNALRNPKLDPGATIAVFGIGGLVHLAIQFAAKWVIEPSPSPAV